MYISFGKHYLAILNSFSLLQFLQYLLCKHIKVIFNDLEVLVPSSKVATGWVPHAVEVAEQSIQVLPVVEGEEQLVVSEGDDVGNGHRSHPYILLVCLGQY